VPYHTQSDVDALGLDPLLTSCLDIRLQSSHMMVCMSSGEGPLGPGFPLRPDEYNCRYFLSLGRQWNFSSVDGRIMTAARSIWRGLRNSDQKPCRKRSSAERLGARRRPRFTIWSCCFMSRLSVTMALAPPGSRSLAIVVSRCDQEYQQVLHGGAG
jgi:hypothetical protein